MPFSKLIEKWKSYRFRFVPWIIFNLNQRVKERSTRLVVTPNADALIRPEKLEEIIYQYLPKLHRANVRNTEEISAKNMQVMLKELGYNVHRAKSQISGTGVFVAEGEAKKGAVVALYPGTIYRPFEPILLPSLNNSFIFRCLDGTHIDGKDRGMSKMIFKSVAGRDRMGPTEIADTSWLTPYPINPWSVGQYVNNSTRELPCNVAYQECELRHDFPGALLALLPYVPYRPGGARRVVALVATTDISAGTELLSSYYTLVGQGPPLPSTPGTPAQPP